VHTVEPIIGGDGRVYCIAAASLVAKVTRDRLMRVAGTTWPGYGLEGHKGYGTAAHMAAVHKLGPSPIHRLTFAPLKNWYPIEALKAKAVGGQVERAASPPKAGAKAQSRKRART
jgi:ribonuclease HII